MCPIRWINIRLAIWCCVLGGGTEIRSAPWLEMTSKQVGLAAWQDVAKDNAWQEVGDVRLSDSNQKTLIAQPGEGVIASLNGNSPDLKSKQLFSDVDIHVEFMIPRGSNSGVKLMGLYEVQINDSHGEVRPTADDCGGIYPRAEQQPNYHLIDEGTPPRVNAAKVAGEWQTLDVEFVAPRFDAAGRKLSNARFVSVVLNGQLIHENVELEYPTGKAWRLESETSRGPLLLQGDHGPVAFRHVRVRSRQKTDRPKSTRAQIQE
jgi:Domain of Unknown Function (DUF1080)